MDLLPKIASDGAALVLTDPPYGINLRRGGRRQVLNDERPYIWWLGEAYRITRPRGVLLCFCRWDVQEVWRTAIAAAGFEIRGQVVWDKLAHGMGDTARTFSPGHELLWFATKGDFTWPAGPPRSLLRAGRPGRERIHPTEKPVGLLANLIEATTRPGDLVVDPFAGSGSTGEAALRLGRAFFGVELDGKHARRARDRLAGLRRRLPPQCPTSLSN